jgi:uncharacterized Zn-finger protein
MIQRYDLCGDYEPEMVSMSDGDWVKWADVKDLVVAPANTIQQAKVATCCWTETEECWETQCGHSFVFTADGPTENGMVFCPYCGGKLTTIG